MKYTNLQVEQMTSFIIFESAHINITPCVNLGTGGEKYTYGPPRPIHWRISEKALSVLVVIFFCSTSD